MKLNSEDLEMKKWNKPTDRAQRIDEKNGVICLFIMFAPAVTVIKMLMSAKNWSQLGPFRDAEVFCPQ